jgi:hypothetical protein
LLQIGTGVRLRSGGVEREVILTPPAEKSRTSRRCSSAEWICWLESSIPYRSRYVCNTPVDIVGYQSQLGELCIVSLTALNTLMFSIAIPSGVLRKAYMSDDDDMEV